LKELNFVVVV